MDKTRINKHNAERLVKQKFKPLLPVIKDREVGRPLDKYMADEKLRDTVSSRGTTIGAVLTYIVDNIKVKLTKSEEVL